MTAPADILRAAATRLRDAPRDESDEALADWLDQIDWRTETISGYAHALRLARLVLT